MDGLILIRQARAAGLSIQRSGDRLVVRGPKRAEAVARRVLGHKAAVLAALAPEAPPSAIPQPWPPSSPYGEPYASDPLLGERSPLAPTRACRCCGGRRWWRLASSPPGGMPTCRACHPPIDGLIVTFEDTSSQALGSVPAPHRTCGPEMWALESSAGARTEGC